jgi:ParB/RepB/Spo0J family partition protein
LVSETFVDNPIVELELRQLDLSHAALRIVDSSSQSRLMVSIETQGQLLPVVVVQQDQRHILIDGFARVRALRRLGKDTVLALVLGCNEADALLWCYRQGQGRRPTAIEEAWLVHELHSHQHQGLPEIAMGLSRSKSWVSRRLGLVRTLPETIQQLVRQGAVSPHAAMRTLLPLARANADAAHDIAAIAKTEQLSSRQLSRLCAAWRAGDAAQRQQLLAEPRLYLRLDEHLGEKQTAACELPALVRDFETLTAIARRCTHVLRHPERCAKAGAVEALLVGWPRVCRAFRELTHIVEEQTHVELRHPGCDSHATQ